MKVFVSHADADQQIALLFVVLLKNGIGLTDFFCSSTKGAITNGQFFVQFILNELRGAGITISLLSPKYFESQFCIAELGSAIIAQFEDRALFNSFIIPPTRFGDLGGMLIGVQSEQLDDVEALDGLCRRLGGNPEESAWTEARDAFQKVIKPILDLRKAEDIILRNLNILDFWPDWTDDNKVVFKSKIRVLLKNNSEQSIEVSNLRWIDDGEGVPLQVPRQNFKVLQLETQPGWHKGAWASEAEKITVPNGTVFRLWLGLHQSISPDDLRRRHEGQQLGKIELQVKINGIDLTWEKQL